MKTNRFLLAVACTTMTFTFFACSDDKDDTPTYGKGACYNATLPMLPGVQTCMKATIDITEALCERRNNERESGWIYRESCESNPTLTCKTEDADKGIVGTIYFYGTIPSGFSCANLDDD
ncbi:MAG: hypothetical protein LBQ87_02310 [Candidatus Fibromonas sp.]|jgi:hypothetical protein|nr:hypothetical protein [Candidatus Fibromonas sp.]